MSKIKSNCIFPLVCEDRWFFIAHFLRNRHNKPADKGFKPMTHRNSTMTPGECDWFCARPLT